MRRPSAGRRRAAPCELRQMRTFAGLASWVCGVGRPDRTTANKDVCRRRVRVTVTGPNPYDPSMSQPIGERKRTVEEALAQGMAGWSRVGSGLAKPLEELGALDRAVYQAVAAT